MESINTDRFILMPLTLDIAGVLLKRDYDVIKEMGLNIGRGWPTGDTMDILPVLESKLKESREPTGFGMWLVVKKEDLRVIGDAGFKGEPDLRGEVEIGYGIAEEERRKGYGFEAAKVLVDWALSREDINAVKAECLTDNIPSIRILEKLGMVETGRDDSLIYWRISKR